MRCPDDGLELREGVDGHAACGLCRGRVLTAAAFSQSYPGVRAVLAPERDRASGAFARVRACPRCAAPMAPHRIGELLAWLEVCEPCQLLWVEKLDERVIAALRARLARAQAFAALPEAARRRMATEMAGELVEHQHEARRLNDLRALLELLDGWP